MTNEELAIMAAQGDIESLHKLYFAVAPLLYKLISQYFPLCKSNLAEPEDLLQCGYFAVLEAVKYFSPDKGLKFTSYLGFCVQNACNTELGYRGKKQIKTISLETPVTDDEMLTLEDIIKDPNADIYEYYELSNLQLIVRSEIDKLFSRRGKIVIYYRFYENKTYGEIDEIMGWRRKRAWYIRCAMFERLRNSEAMQELRKAYFSPKVNQFSNPEETIASLEDIGLEIL